MSIEFRFAVNVTPKPGILDPQGRAVEGSLGHLGIEGVSGIRVGRRVELTVVAMDEAGAAATVERLAAELLSNPLIEAYAVERLQATSSASTSPGVAAAVPAGAAAGAESDVR
ncbi:MAG: phosphoribosylformylglycinamidine synthase subunit PurS [Candidatus Limnocylindrales bacterium]